MGKSPWGLSTTQRTNRHQVKLQMEEEVVSRSVHTNWLSSDKRPTLKTHTCSIPTEQVILRNIYATPWDEGWHAKGNGRLGKQELNAQSFITYESCNLAEGSLWSRPSITWLLHLLGGTLDCVLLQTNRLWSRSSITWLLRLLGGTLDSVFLQTVRKYICSNKACPALTTVWRCAWVSQSGEQGKSRPWLQSSNLATQVHFEIY